MSNEAIIRNLLQGVEFGDPRLYDLLDKMVGDFYLVYNELHPPAAARAFGETGVSSGAGTVVGFAATLFTNNLRLNWSTLDGAINYEIRYHFGTGTDWATGTSLLFTSTLQADFNPLTIPLIYGNHTFLLKGINPLGVYSTDPSIVVVNIPQIPAVVITPTVIDNNVLLKWTIPDSVLQLAAYNVYKNDILQGVMNGTFEAIFETTGGTFDYTVEAVDIVGNIGTQSTITATVNQPPDYELRANFISTFTGTLVNCILELGKLIACINTAETFTGHFTSRGWSSYDDADVAGYHLMIEPSLTTGSYEEVIDYGLLLTNTILTVLYSSNEIDPSVAVVIKIASSTDNITYTGFTTASSVFIPSLRYAKIRLEFTGADTTSLISIDSLQARLDVKREVDSGTASALASDAAGTVVTFGKTFKDIDSITVTANSKSPTYPIYDFVDAPNPVSFKVLVFDSTGNRVDATITWKARGIV